MIWHLPNVSVRKRPGAALITLNKCFRGYQKAVTVARNSGLHYLLAAGCRVATKSATRLVTPPENSPQRSSTEKRARR